MERARGFLELIDRQALHAEHLMFVHPATDSPVTLEAPLPDDMETLVNALRQGKPKGGER
jgi:23S rRNA pseudouridine1911/1915/1917 synthase